MTVTKEQLESAFKEVIMTQVKLAAELPPSEALKLDLLVAGELIQETQQPMLQSSLLVIVSDPNTRIQSADSANWVATVSGLLGSIAAAGFLAGRIAGRNEVIQKGVDTFLAKLDIEP